MRGGSSPPPVTPPRSGVEYAVPGLAVLFALLCVQQVVTAFFSVIISGARGTGCGHHRPAASTSPPRQVIDGIRRASCCSSSRCSSRRAPLRIPPQRLRTRTGPGARGVLLGDDRLRTAPWCRHPDPSSSHWSSATCSPCSWRGSADAFGPVESLPTWMQTIAPASPAYWALQAMRSLTLDHAGALDALGPVDGTLSASLRASSCSPSHCSPCAGGKESHDDTSTGADLPRRRTVGSARVDRRPTVWDQLTMRRPGHRARGGPDDRLSALRREKSDLAAALADEFWTGLSLPSTSGVPDWRGLRARTDAGHPRRARRAFRTHPDRRDASDHLPRGARRGRRGHRHPARPRGSGRSGPRRPRQRARDDHRRLGDGRVQRSRGVGVRRCGDDRGRGQSTTTPRQHCCRSCPTSAGSSPRGGPRRPNGSSRRASARSCTAGRSPSPRHREGGLDRVADGIRTHPWESREQRLADPADGDQLRHRRRGSRHPRLDDRGDGAALRARGSAGRRCRCTSVRWRPHRWIPSPRRTRTSSTTTRCRMRSSSTTRTFGCTG